MIDWDDPREAALLRRLLEREERERGDGVAQGLLDRMNAEGRRHHGAVAQARARALEHQPVVLGALQQAAEQGTYVAAGVQSTLTPNARDPYVHTRADAYWNGVLRLLDEQGIPTQMIVRERTGGGVSNLGYRLAPDGDDRRTLTEADVWREGGRCARCGCSQDFASLAGCRWIMGGTTPGHDFQSSEEADDGGVGAVGRPDAGASDQASGDDRGRGGAAGAGA